MRDHTATSFAVRRLRVGWFRLPGKRGPGRGRSSAAGQSFVELVLVLPVLIILAVAVGDFGRVYTSGVAVEDAAREAADYMAFDNVSASHFTTPGDPSCADPGTPPVQVCARDATRFEALRHACSAVSALPGYSEVAVICSDPNARCATTTDPTTAPGASGFCQLVIEPAPASGPWLLTCGPADPLQSDATCGWMVHVTITLDFHTALNFPPLPTTVHLVRDSRYAISALPAGA